MYMISAQRELRGIQAQEGYKSDDVVEGTSSSACSSSAVSPEYHDRAVDIFASDDPHQLLHRQIIHPSEAYDNHQNNSVSQRIYNNVTFNSYRGKGLEMPYEINPTDVSDSADEFIRKENRIINDADVFRNHVYCHNHYGLLNRCNNHVTSRGLNASNISDGIYQGWEDTSSMIGSRLGYLDNNQLWHTPNDDSKENDIHASENKKKNSTSTINSTRHNDYSYDSHNSRKEYNLYSDKEPLNNDNNIPPFQAHVEPEIDCILEKNHKQTLKVISDNNMLDHDNLLEDSEAGLDMSVLDWILSSQSISNPSSPKYAASSPKYASSPKHAASSPKYASMNATTTATTTTMINQNELLNYDVNNNDNNTDVYSKELLVHPWSSMSLSSIKCLNSNNYLSGDHKEQNINNHIIATTNDTNNQIFRQYSTV